MQTIASRLRKLRLKKGLSLREVAGRIDVPVSTYRDWEYGKAIRGEPYQKLAELFDVSVQELVTGASPSKVAAVEALEEVRKKLEAAIVFVQAL